MRQSPQRKPIKGFHDITDADIDEATAEGISSVSAGVKMPGWVARHQILIDAWNIGRRLANEKKPSSSTT